MIHEDRHNHINSASNLGVRVIVVGRTELITRLRRHPDVELIRAHDGSAAIAELATPIDESSPTPCVVLVGRTTDPSDHDAAEFNNALRRVNNSVRTAAIANARNASAFDESLDEHLTDEALDDFLARAGTTPATSTHAPTTATTNTNANTNGTATSPPSQQDQPTKAPTPTHPTPPTRPASTTAPQTTTSDNKPNLKKFRTNNHTDPLAALLAHADPLQPALDAARAECSPHQLHFTPGSADDLPSSVSRIAPIVCKGQRLGWLGSPSLDAASLEHQASRLGMWILLARRQRALRRAAYTDPLTGAYNRRYFDRFIARSIQLARDNRHTVAVLLFDLDNFKTFNDRFGHQAGDNILIHTVRLLRSAIRPTDRVCRIGGDEFVVVFTNPDGPRDPASKPLTPKSIKELAKRFQRQISAHRFPDLGAHAPGELSISGGLATFPWDGNDAESLIRCADQLAMRCKSAGKNLIDFGPGVERAE